MIADKQLANFLYVGVLRAALPGARIVHCRRNPAATCFAMYRQCFTAGRAESDDLTDAIRYYAAYDRLMEHWRVVAPDACFEVVYEDLVAAPEAGTCALLDYCGLPWDPACLRFHEAQRRVRTASAGQVRRPVYTGAVERWRPYESRLREAAEAAGVSFDWLTGAAPR